MSRRNGALSQHVVDRIVADIGAVRHAGLPAPFHADQAGTNLMESIFLAALAKRRPGSTVLRHGWPDFLVEHQGSYMGIEVKNGHDVLNPRQRATFAALNALGLAVYVWHPSTPDVLTPWRRYRPPAPPRPSVADRRDAKARQSVIDEQRSADTVERGRG